MNQIINFLKEIFMLKEDESTLVGLSQLKVSKQAVKATTEPKKNKEMKISDLMRGY